MSTLAWVVTLTVFSVAVVVRLGIFTEVHSEGDERIYMALVDQLENGRGYTLRGHPIFNEPWLIRELYDRPLFHHPPGGIGFFWLLYHWFGDKGLGLAQILAFSVFFWSMVGLGRLVLNTWTPLSAFVLSGLAAFNPIISLVYTHYWLDGPQIAFASAGCTLFLLAVIRGRVLWSVLAGEMLGWACLTKLNAVLIFPGMLLLALAVTRERPIRRLILPATITFLIVAALIAPWLFLQWIHYGELFPFWAGKPVPELLAANRWVYFMTVVRTPWSYFRLLPQTVWTIVPSLLLLVWLRSQQFVRITGLVLTLWIGLILFIHVGLGFIGYSKLLRYVILITPATILLFTLVSMEGLNRLRADRNYRAFLSKALLTLAAIAFALEIAHGFQTIWIYPDWAHIRSMVTIKYL